MFVSSNGLVKAFAIGEAAKMERASPAIFVQVGCEVVVVSSKGGIFRLSSLAKLLDGKW
jgi:hypothetical protein